MSILSKFFGNKTQKENPFKMIGEPLSKASEAQVETIPPADLFIDNEEPQSLYQLAAEPQSKISVFLSRNYHSIGTSDGYEYHSQESLEVGKDKIKAEFQLILDQAIQEKLGSRLQMKHMIVYVGKIADTTRQTLENTIEELNASLDLLQKQKELSSENKGWVMNAVHSYHQGFIQGLNDYIIGENLLNSIKNI